MRIDRKKTYVFHNNVDYCVGTGRMGLALAKEYQDELKIVQEEIGFKHIRGHGLFCADMGIYEERRFGKKTYFCYNFTYLDRVMDSYIEQGLEPFLELGFMPEALASGDQTIFVWKGNVTPPKSYEKWADLVSTTLTHLCDRYGRDRVVTWPVEVWNEPNLPGFWKDADMEEYFKLFKITYKAVKKVDPRFTVGGPAVCGVKDEFWIRSFLDFCKKEKLSPDFITRHHYTTEMPQFKGHFTYQQLSDPFLGFDNLKTSRVAIDSYKEFKGLPIHITEFNTSYTPTNPIHDTNENAAYIAHQLSHLGDVNESYSYWTFGDVFEEAGIPHTYFHGGFGLVAAGCVRKPTFWTFAFFKKLQELSGRCIYKDEECVIVESSDKKEIRGIVWNRDKKTLKKDFTLPVKDKKLTLIRQTVDPVTTNPLKLWHDIGEPAAPSKEQIDLLKKVDSPCVTSKILTAPSGDVKLDFSIRGFGVEYFTLTPCEMTSDQGYDYAKVARGSK
ncbi:MAG: xylan 1,4-beta-xylosidase [Clostridiales bacterium]|nr:xylan 1,4-beta-xylosidase [Clostridiales bacterium]